MRIYLSNPSAKNKSLVEFVEEIEDFRDKIEDMTLVDFFDYIISSVPKSKLNQI